MSDWRLRGQENWLAGKTLYQIVFPDFWGKAYREQNDFFRKMTEGPVTYVKENGRWQRIGEREASPMDWHEHCDFCWEKAKLDKAGTFYFTGDMRHCVCEECFRDFCEQFRWKVLDGEALVARLVKEEEEP